MENNIHLKDEISEKYSKYLIEFIVANKLYCSK